MSLTGYPIWWFLPKWANELKEETSKKEKEEEMSFKDQDLGTVPYQAPGSPIPADNPRGVQLPEYKFTSGAVRSGGKPEWSLMPWGALREILRRFEIGVKYGRNNWKRALGTDDHAFVRQFDAHMFEHYRHFLELVDLPHDAQIDGDGLVANLAAFCWNAVALLFYAIEDQGLVREAFTQLPPVPVGKLPLVSPFSEDKSEDSSVSQGLYSAYEANEPTIEELEYQYENAQDYAEACKKAAEAAYEKVDREKKALQARQGSL
jgi:hypothetical protein